VLDTLRLRHHRSERADRTVTVEGGLILDGHHRLLAALDADEDIIVVVEAGGEASRQLELNRLCVLLRPRCSSSQAAGPGWACVQEERRG
jgi:hypothetical protein